MYNYVKGRGWLPEAPYETLEHTLPCGTKVRLEARRPLLGERYTCAWSDNWCKAPGVIDLDKIKGFFGRFAYIDTCTQEDYAAYDNADPSYARGWVTVVPC